MMAIEARFAPRQEIYSIDESFLDFEGVRGDLVAIGRELRDTVLREVGLPTCVGLGPHQDLGQAGQPRRQAAERKPGSYPASLAQVCNVAAMTRAEREQLFAATPVGEVWGIGKKIGARLNDAGVHTVLDFVRCDAASIRKSFSVVVEKTLLELRGTPCMSLDDVPALQQADPGLALVREGRHVRRRCSSRRSASSLRGRRKGCATRAASPVRSTSSSRPARFEPMTASTA
jgi:DNA polymerase V